MEADRASAAAAAALAAAAGSTAGFDDPDGDADLAAAPDRKALRESAPEDAPNPKQVRSCP